MERSVVNKIRLVLVLSLACILLLNWANPSAVHAAVTYKISYNANGGSGAPAAQLKKPGVNIQLSSKKPTRTGHTFQGWSGNAKATTPAYLAGGIYRANASVTLYAVWKKNTYRITYSANGGSGAPAAQTKIYGTTLALSATRPTRTGYAFQGWALSPTAVAVTYNPGGKYTINSAATLYAVWEKVTYRITYNANGGSGAPSAQTKTYGKVLTLSSTKPAWSGHIFQGWSTSSSATTAAYQPGGKYTANSAATLYAVWAKSSYKITYNANGGSGAPATQTKIYGKNITLSRQKPSRTDFVFMGWSTSPTATTAAYQPGSTYTANAAATLYAVWKVNKTLDVPLYKQTTLTTCGSASGIMILKYYGIDVDEETFKEQAKKESGEYYDYTMVFAVKDAINQYLEDYGKSTRYKYTDTSSYSEDQYQDLIIKNITNGYPVQPVMVIPTGDGYFPYSTTGHYVVVKGVRHILGRGYFAVCNDPHPDHSGVYNVPISKIKEYNKVHSGFVICVR